ncbi:hypothetical protein ACWIGX_27055 [Streptomyces nigrescens]
MGFLPESPAAACGELWHIHVKGRNGTTGWHQSFGPDTRHRPSPDSSQLSSPPPATTAPASDQEIPHDTPLDHRDHLSRRRHHLPVRASAHHQR